MRQESLCFLIRLDFFVACVYPGPGSGLAEDVQNWEEAMGPDKHLISSCQLWSESDDTFFKLMAHCN